MSDRIIGASAQPVNPTETQTEIWKPICGFEGHYEVSSLGRVKSRHRLMRHKAGGFALVHEKILRPDCATGYERVSLHRDGKLFRELVHRLVARAFLAGGVPRQHVNHIDGNKRNNRIDNLEWTTPRDNVAHAWAMGLCSPLKGEGHGMSRLKERDVAVIRDAAVRGVSQRWTATVFGVTEACVSSIIRNQSWKIREVA